MFLFSLFYLSPFVDASNGFLIFNDLLAEGSLFSPGQLFRFFMTVFTFLFLKRSDLFIILILSTFFLFIEFVSFNFHFNLSGFILGLVYSYKVVYAILVFFALKNIVEDLCLIDLIKLFRNSALIYAIILISSIVLGINEPTYASGTFGTKGLFASGNGISIFLGVSSLIAYYYYELVPKRNNFISFLLISFSMLMVGTKASIIFAVLIFVVLFYNSNFKKKVAYLTIPFLFSIFYLDKITLIFSTVFDVIIFRYNNSASLFSFLASNRDNYITGAFETFNIDGVNIVRIITGSGVFVSFRNFSETNLIYDTLESDFFDLFFAFGSIGLLLYLCFILYGFRSVFKNFNLTLFLGWFAIIGYSIIAGHVIFNAMSSFALVMLFLIIINNNKKVKE
ncbi:MAG: hypothetical protein ACI9JT_001417 [Polaribacter sp.]|jgi:hypothetical protein